jgi:hypothetical protein
MFKQNLNYLSFLDPNAARREFLTYCLSLMRAHNNEHRDSLPVLDVSALKHVAYVFDTLIYNMRASTGEISQQLSGQGASTSATVENRDSSFLADAWDNQVLNNLFHKLCFSML